MKVKNRIFLDAVGLILGIVMVCIPGNSLVMRIFGVFFVFLYAALVVASVWLSLDTDKATWRRVLNEVIAIYFSIAFYILFNLLTQSE